MNKDINDFMSDFSLEDQAEINAKADVFASEMLAVINAETLNPIRKAFENTQEDLAKKLGVSQVAISKLEKRSDVYVSTLRRYLEAVGASLQMTVKLKNGEVVSLERFGFAKNLQALSISSEYEKGYGNPTIEVKSAEKILAKRKVSTSRQTNSKNAARKKIEA